MRMPRLVAVVAALSLGATLPAGAADFADDCYDGSVLDSSIERPHVWDPANDQTPKGPTHGDSTDLRSAWVSGEDAQTVVLDSRTEDGAAVIESAWPGRRLTAHVQVTEMAVHPVNASYRFVFNAAGEEKFVSAQAMPEGTWQFRHGYIDRSDPALARQVTVGPTEGAVDQEAGVISVDLVGDFQLYPDEPSLRRLDVLEVRSQILVGSWFGNPGGLLPISGLLMNSDNSGNGWRCDVLIFTADEDPADWGHLIIEPDPEG